MTESGLIMQVYAALQFSAAVLFYMGSRCAVILLIVLTLVQGAVMHNPCYKKHTTEVERARAAR